MEVLKEIMVVSEAENNKQTDADILRTRDIIPASPPPQKKEAEQEPKSQKTDENTAPLPKPAVSINKKEESETLQEKTEIPRFDLAEDIMAEQRKIAATKRKAPGKKTEAERLELQAEPVGYTTIEPSAPTLPEQDRIIAEIVARDIERLHQGNTSDARG
jgi:hypothetical protein